MSDRKLPLYQCHKQVRAAKILSHSSPDVHPVELNLEGGIMALVSPAWFAEKKVGATGDPPTLGYYVVYEDGYASWSPTKAFEEGYTRLEGSN